MISFTGRDILERTGLVCAANKTCGSSYDPHVDAVLLSEYTNGVMRTFHKDFPNEVRLFGRKPNTKDKTICTKNDFKQIDSYLISHTVMKTDLVNEKYIPSLRGMIFDAVQDRKSGYGSECRNRLFRDKHGNGLDLDAMDTMRGREAGLRSYAEYLELFTGHKVTNWTHFQNYFEPKKLNLLKQIFTYPENVDVKFGTILERKAYGYTGIVKANIFIRQFSITKNGDRHFYTNKNYTKGNAIRPIDLS